MRRQEEALHSLGQSIMKIERKLGESEAKPKRTEYSFDSISLQASQRKQNQNKDPNTHLELDLPKVTEELSEIVA
jgi:hypothetical protein